MGVPTKILRSTRGLQKKTKKEPSAPTFLRLYFTGLLYITGLGRISKALNGVVTKQIIENTRIKHFLTVRRKNRKKKEKKTT